MFSTIDREINFGFLGHSSGLVKKTCTTCFHGVQLDLSLLFACSDKLQKAQIRGSVATITCCLSKVLLQSLQIFHFLIPSLNAACIVSI